MSQIFVSRQLNISSRLLVEWEKGESIPDSAMIQLLSEFYGLTEAELLNSDSTSDDSSSKDFRSRLKRRGTK